MKHHDAIPAFQQKRGDSSIAFLVPFLDGTMDVRDDPDSIYLRGRCECVARRP